MSRHSRHNTGRLTAAVTAAGVVQYTLIGVTNAGFLRHDWHAWRKALDPIIQFPAHDSSLMYWFLEALVLGFAGMWLYTSIRPKFGAGPLTAAKAGVAVWLVGWVTTLFNQLAIGAIPENIALINCGAGLIASVGSIMAGAWLYKEAA
jgi:hypothetical protein